MAQPPPPITRPTPVTVACALFVVTALLMLVQAAFVGTYRAWMTQLVERQLDLMGLPESGRPDISSSISSSLVQTGASLVIGAAFWIFIAAFVWRGKYWARILAIVFGMIGAIAGPLSLLFVLALAPPPAVYFATSIPGLVTILVGMMLVWRQPAKAWFDAMRPPPQPARRY